MKNGQSNSGRIESDFCSGHNGFQIRSK